MQAQTGSGEGMGGGSMFKKCRIANPAGCICTGLVYRYNVFNI